MPGPAAQPAPDASEPGRRADTPESRTAPGGTTPGAPVPVPAPRWVDRRALLAAGAAVVAAGGTTAWVLGPGTPSGTARPAALPSHTPVRPAASRRPAAVPPPSVPPSSLTTLHSVAAPCGKSGYRRLADGPGWRRVVRTDIAPAYSGRDRRRTVLAAFVQITDLHVVDVQSPLRFEWMRVHAPHDWRPHEALSAAGTVALVERINGLRGGPATGAPLTCAVTTGDNTDNNSSVELDWFLTAMTGGVLTPNTGDPSGYEGIQNSGLTLFWQPESARADNDKKLGFPHLPGYLSAAVSPVTSPGLNLPWYSTVGNHDALFSGAYVSGASGFAAEVATGSRKLEQVGRSDALRAYEAAQKHTDPDGTVLRDILQHYASAARTVTPDARRVPFTPQQYLDAHLDPRRTGAGPLGHGYAADGVDADHLYYAFDLAEDVLGVSLDTTDRGGSFLGSIGTAQLNWLDRVLTANEDRYAIVFSHHTSHTMTNLIPDPAHPDEKRHDGKELTALLGRHRNVLAWVNGHSHLNKIEAHGSFWEVNTASHVDYPQLARVIELVDNHDGTLSLFTTLIESAAPHRTDFADLSPIGLASLYRELGYNAPGAQITRFTGAERDRNTELLLTKR